MFKRCNECIDAKNSAKQKIKNDMIKIVHSILFKFLINYDEIGWLCKLTTHIFPSINKCKCLNKILLPDCRRSIRLLAIEIDVKFVQCSNGLLTVCLIELLSKLMANKDGVCTDVDALHKTLKNISNEFLIN